MYPCCKNSVHECTATCQDMADHLNTYGEFGCSCQR